MLEKATAWEKAVSQQMHCSEKGLNGRAEEGLMHVFNSILDVCDCVDVVGLLWHAFGRHGCAWCGSGRGSGSDRKPPQIGEGILFASEDKALVPDVACGFCECC